MMAASIDAKTFGVQTEFSYRPSTSRNGQYTLSTGRSQFIGTDGVLLKEYQDAMPNVWLLPVMAQAVVVGFHLPDFLNLTDGLRIPREALAEIFLGRIVRWSELADWNPQLKSVDENISLVVRADPSGICQSFASALSSFSPEWDRKVGAYSRGKVGSGAQPKWPRADFSVPGDAGAAMQIRLQPYSLGYVSQAYAKMYGVKQALVSNRAGEYVAPTPSAVKAAMDALAPQFEELYNGKTQVFFTTRIVDPARIASAAYPISMLTYFAFDADKLAVDCNDLHDVLYLLHWAWTSAEAASIAFSESFSQITVSVYGKMISKLRDRIRCNDESPMEQVLYEKAPACDLGCATQVFCTHVRCSLSCDGPDVSSSRIPCRSRLDLTDSLNPKCIKCEKGSYAASSRVSVCTACSPGTGPPASKD